VVNGKFIRRSFVALCLGCLFSSVAIAASPAHDTGVVQDQAQSDPSAGTARHSDNTAFLPADDLFRPLLADPKEPRFYLSVRLFEYEKVKKTEAFTGGYGEIFGLYRHMSATGGWSWQSNFGGGIHAQFDLRAPSMDLVNADYTIGFPISFRKGAESWRVTPYHQSSHLGDEFLLRNNIDRIELSYESIDVTGSYEWSKWRVYYGGEYLVHKEPKNLKPLGLHGGVEYYGTDRVIGRGRLVGGWDLKSDEEHAWSMNSSLKIGLQFDSSENNGRYIRVLAEGYKGFTPYGQFYSSRSGYAGIGVYLGFE
jgi:hypothetical protein